ncbi:SpoIIAA family protein [Pontibacter cellulosilyticus]|uniref:STAS/SEC14 domain-containing protein n=1 Tax=Pontibacter cellulosilyticus TaxID=1720253 RepID=A0A923N7Q1_9BACT|nr:STAS/SEC14 domain-containing protein [Pontibacter cellulosilyticus]MBC5993724.1 STAS/SEC14 domain-containing protein [Pontibacter cellulosilyticus]
MLEILPETHENILAVRISGELAIADFDAYRNLLRDLMQLCDEVHLYYEMADVKWVHPVAAIENALFDVVHGLDYGRVAMVGEKWWQKLAAKLISPVKKYGVRYYEMADKERAMRWLLEGEWKL